MRSRNDIDICHCGDGLELDIIRLDHKLPARRHRIPRVDGKVQNRRFEFGRIDLNAPRVFDQSGPHHYLLAQSVLEEIGHPGNKYVDVKHMGFEGLSPRKRQQFLGELRGLPGAAGGIFECSQQGGLGDCKSTLSTLQIAEHDGQEIIEIVCYPSRQQSNRFHFCRMP